MPSRLRRRVDALAAMTVSAPWSDPASNIDPGDLTSIARVCRDTERLKFGYTARDGTRTDRRVEPYRLVLLGRRWYLVAWDMNRSDWRSFRLDRLTEPRPTGAQFVAWELPADDAAQFVRRGIDNLPTRHDVEAVVHADASDVRSRIGSWASTEEMDGARCRLRMSTDSLDWVLMTLGRTGADFEVVSPSAVIDHARQWSERFGRAVDRHDRSVSRFAQGDLQD